MFMYVGYEAFISDRFYNINLPLHARINLANNLHLLLSLANFVIFKPIIFWYFFFYLITTVSIFEFFFKLY